MKITFLGAGVFGSALAKIAEYNGHEVRFYDPIKYPELKIGDVIDGADLAVYVAPSNAYADILPELPDNLPLVCASKGFLSKTPFARFKDFSALGGAAFADDVLTALKDSAESTDDSEDDTNLNVKEISFTASSATLEQIFSAEKIKVEYTEDTLGIMLCGALKNVYAIGAGMYGDGSVPISYLETVIVEMADILEANGASKETLKLSCGAQDLMLSCTEGSRNYRYGEQLKKSISEKSTSENQPETIEGVSVIKSLPDHPDFALPESANIFREIVAAVESNITQKG